jgi:hypothetical protein
MGDSEFGANTWEHSAQGPHGGGFQLSATQDWDCWTDHDAILTLDVSDLAGDDGTVSGLEVDFWLRFDQRTNVNLPDRRTAHFYVRGEEDEPWVDVGGELSPPEGVYTHYTYDLGAVLAAHRIAPDDDVYLRFNRRGFHKRSAVSLDDIGIRQVGNAAAAPSPVAGGIGIAVAAVDAGAGAVVQPDPRDGGVRPAVDLRPEQHLRPEQGVPRLRAARHPFSASGVDAAVRDFDGQRRIPSRRLAVVRSTRVYSETSQMADRIRDVALADLAASR